MTIPPILQVGEVLLSSDILTEMFCCDLAACHGACCVEGDAGAPVSLDEIADLESRLDDIWPHMTAGAKAEVNAHGVAYTDREGDLVTSIVDGRDCVFAHQGCLNGGEATLCLVEDGKPISCALYPLREKQIGGLTCLNYHRWAICKPAVEQGRRLSLPLYRFLKQPLIRRFGPDWYRELCEVAQQLLSQ